MQDFIDLRGVSGATYRYRAWSDVEEGSPVAGNYAVVATDEDGLKVLFTATSNDLSHPPGVIRNVVHRLEGFRIYARLNVSRAAREAEDEDICAYYGSLREPEPSGART